MKKVNALTRHFIYENIKINETICSYPLRTVAPKIYNSTNDTRNSAIISKTKNNAEQKFLDKTNNLTDPSQV
ncbi:hypothetical protein GCM10009111_03310 [Colwellia asteriadis]|uniref:Uncharacterized protein n=1 Tax=Colwellia asteriadis TaxID=517723 RepID=A0ABN1L2V0_9GAMM